MNHNTVTANNVKEIGIFCPLKQSIQEKTEIEGKNVLFWVTIVKYIKAKRPGFEF